MSDYERIRGLVRREVESIPSPARRSALEAILVHPTAAGRGAKPPGRTSAACSGSSPAIGSTAWS